ncbi:MAG: ABC transporter permease [Duodenibacillus sp.]|nr:ABC transporter permease [Duodenibacillus sp.]
MEVFGCKLVLLATDAVLLGLAAALAAYARCAARNPALAAKWRRVLSDRTAVACAAALSIFFALALADSVHLRPRLDAAAFSTKTVSLLDVCLAGRIAGLERSYSAPFALREFDKSAGPASPAREFARLRGAGLGVPDEGHAAAVARDAALGCAAGLGAAAALAAAVTAALALRRRRGLAEAWRSWSARANPWRPALFVWLAAAFAAGWLAAVWPHWHVLGTDATGNDVLYTALKSVRTAMAIGLLATLCTLPFAVTLGIAAGYFKGWVDDAVQYVYTTISSIPSVLLLAASALMIQVFIDKNPQFWETGLERADARLFLLSLIIGVTGWAGLARLLRAETLKVSAMDYVTAARAFGAGPFAIMARHVLPNVAHIVLIVAVLDFSGIVLYEAVLSYIGIGVDPVMQSFGSMINAAAGEMSRTPAVWWNLLGSFLFMVALVLSANLFASGVRDAFDPRAQERGDGRA